MPIVVSVVHTDMYAYIYTALHPHALTHSPYAHTDVGTVAHRGRVGGLSRSISVYRTEAPGLNVVLGKIIP